MPYPDLRCDHLVLLNPFIVIFSARTKIITSCIYRQNLEKQMTAKNLDVTLSWTLPALDVTRLDWVSIWFQFGSIWFKSFPLESTFHVLLVFLFESVPETETKTVDIFCFGTACRGKIGKIIAPFFLPEGTGIATVEIGKGKAQFTVVGD